MILIADLLEFSYAGTSSPVLTNFGVQPVSFQRLALLGTSGSGKSTLLKLIGGFLKPSSGWIRVESHSKESIRCGYVSQEDALLPWLTVERNIKLSAKLIHGENNHQLQEHGLRLVESFGLEDRLYSLPYQLSGGMRKRAALAASLLSGADLHLLDEPFSGSDQMRRKAMYSVIHEVCKHRETGFIFTTHDVVDVIELADTVLWLDESETSPVTMIDASRGWTEALRYQLLQLMLGENEK